MGFGIKEREMALSDVFGKKELTKLKELIKLKQEIIEIRKKISKYYVDGFIRLYYNLEGRNKKELKKLLEAAKRKLLYLEFDSTIGWKN
jgi:hypothetical protein